MARRSGVRGPGRRLPLCARIELERLLCYRGQHPFSPRSVRKVRIAAEKGVALGSIIIVIIIILPACGPVRRSRPGVGVAGLPPTHRVAGQR